MKTQLTSGSAIEFTYLDGTVVTGRLLRPWGERGWYLAELTDDTGHTSREVVYGRQIRLV